MCLCAALRLAHPFSSSANHHHQPHHHHHHETRYGAIVGGEDRIVKLPRGGGVLGMAPSACAIDTHLSCFPSLIDALAADRNVSRLVSICGNEVRGCVGGWVCMY